MNHNDSTSLAAAFPTTLAHEKLDAYRYAEALDELVVAVCKRAPRGHSWMLDQIHRASESMVLNLVEANGRVGADRKQLLRVSRSSALEVDAALGLLARRGMVRDDERARARQLTVAVVNLVSGLMRV